MYYFTEKEKEILISELSKLSADWRDVLEWDPADPIARERLSAINHLQTFIASMF